MKVRVIIIPLAVILAAIVVYFVYATRTDPGTQGLTVADIEGLSEKEQDNKLESAFSRGVLPSGAEKELLAWAIQNRPDTTASLLRTHSREFSSLPRHLSDAALELFKRQQRDAGMAAISLARELFPNDPDVLGVTGIIAYLGGRTLDARQFLEEAEAWRHHRPLIDFYLGGILILSESTADRSRGKNLLMRVIKGDDAEYRELAGLTLLGNRNIPMIREDIETVFKTLSDDSVFRVDNSNLSAEVIRILLNRIVPFLPNEALSLADLLIQYPGSTDQDRLGVVQLAQTLGDQKKAAAFLATIDEEAAFPPGSEAALRLERIKAIQLIMEQQFEQGFNLIEKIAKSQPDSPELQNLFKSAFAFEIPMDIERPLLRTYLDLPVNNIMTSLSVIARLMEIDPLGEDQWIDYATRNLLHRDPLGVGQWLTSIGASSKIISSLGDKPDKSSNEHLLLANSYLEVKDPENAQAALRELKNQIDPTIVAYLEARIQAQLGQPNEAFDYWKEAYQGARTGNTFPLLKNLGILAIDLDQNVSALQALYTAFSSGVAFTSAEAGKLLELTLRYGNLQQSIQVAEYLVEMNPDEKGYANNLAYFRFLAEEKVDASIEAMRVIVEANPDVPQYRLTLALGLLKAGRTNEADRLVQSTNVDWNRTDTRGKMIYAVVLAATDKRVLAEGLIQNMNLDELIPEEKALLEAF